MATPKNGEPCCRRQSISIFTITVALMKNETAFSRLNIVKRPQLSNLIGTSDSACSPNGVTFRAAPGCWSTSAYRIQDAKLEATSVRFPSISYHHLDILSAPGKTLASFKHFAELGFIFPSLAFMERVCLSSDIPFLRPKQLTLLYHSTPRFDIPRDGSVLFPRARSPPIYHLFRWLAYNTWSSRCQPPLDYESC